MAFLALRMLRSSLPSNSFCFLFETSTIRIDPVMISSIAGRSYFQTNFSLKRWIDKNIFTTMAREELAASRVRSAYGIAIKWTMTPRHSTRKPVHHHPDL